MECALKAAKKARSRGICAGIFICNGTLGVVFESRHEMTEMLLGGYEVASEDLEEPETFGVDKDAVSELVRLHSR